MARERRRCRPNTARDPRPPQNRIRERIAVHSDVTGRRALVESPWWKAIVLEIRHRREQPRRHLARCRAHDGLVNLHLIARPYLAIVRFEAGGVPVVVVAGNRAGRFNVA